MAGAFFNAIQWPLLMAGKQGRWVMVLALIVGVAFPDFARLFQDYIGAFAIGLVFFAALRIGLQQTIGALSDIYAGLCGILMFQLVFPLAALLVIWLTGGPPQGEYAALIVTAGILMLASAPVSGTPYLSIFCGVEAAAALRLLVLGMVLLPFTTIPVFMLMPGGEQLSVWGAAATLLIAILSMGAGGFGLRRLLRPVWSQKAELMTDGVSAIGTFFLVAGLLADVRAEFMNDPFLPLSFLAIGFVFNYAQQFLVLFSLGRYKRFVTDAPAYAITAGSRNYALLIAALPPEFMKPLLVFIGCFQIPMFLTPMLLTPLFQNFLKKRGAKGVSQ